MKDCAAVARGGERRYLFICGCPRSGTSFLAMLLCRHPAVALGIERFNLRIQRGELRPEDFAAERFFAPRPNDTWYRTLEEYSDPPHYTALVGRYDGARYVGDKFPRGYEHYPELASRFPDVRFIVMLRDPFAVAASYWRRAQDKPPHWPEWRDDRQAVADWNRATAETLAWHRHINLLVVDYESLVLRRLGAERIARFLELDDNRLTDELHAMAVLEDTGKEGALPAAQLDQAQRTIDHEGYRQLLRLAEEAPEPRQAWQVLKPSTFKVDKYSAADGEAMDYEPWALPGSRFQLRGPALQTGRAPLVCIGSAATFGRLAQRPFPRLIAETLGRPVINAGIGGARPTTFLEDPALLATVSAAPLVILEALSARGYATRLFTPTENHSNVGQVPPEYRSRLSLQVAKPFPFVDWVYQRAFARGLEPEALEQARATLLRAYVADMKRLIAAARGPVILFYFSQRSPDLRPTLRTYESWSGGFPHFVDRQVLTLLAPLVAEVVELTSTTGLPAAVRQRDTGAPLPLFPGQADPCQNIYYPSQAMHDEAAQALLPAVRRLLGA